jgi:UDP-GlcNAc:undecaprenyl-phosphate/decaprenyl-phosphate GlcNAc-1-phosphate transferase
MMIAYLVAVSFFCAFVIGLLLTPIARRLARSAGFVDRPDGLRKFHDRAVPLGGGVAVQLAAAIVATATIGGATWAGVISVDGSFLGIFALAALLLTLAGLVDDFVGMRGRYKLAWQVVACSALAVFGLPVQHVSLFHQDVSLGVLAAPIMLLWLLGNINSINLLDGADGVAGSVGVLLCMTVAALAFLSGCPADGLLALAIGGGLLGFLWYNLPPATIYLGDTGSMFIGLAVGALAVHSQIKGATPFLCAVPLCIMAVPALDSIAAVTRRKLTGCSLFAPDHGHIHHILLRRGFSTRQTVLVIVCACSVTCAGALLSLFLRNDVLAVATSVLVIGTLVTCRIFGHVEFLLVIRRCTTMLRRQIAVDAQTATGAVQTSHHLYGSRDWNILWAALSESAETYGLVQMEVRIVIPSISESFYAVWNKPNGVAEEERWSVKIPFCFEGCWVGDLLLVGCAHETVIQTIGAVVEFLEPIEGHIRHAVVELRGGNGAAIASERPDLLPAGATAKPGAAPSELVARPGGNGRNHAANPLRESRPR